MTTLKRECSLLGCLLSPRLYGVIVGLVSLWAMIASLSASIYLMVKYGDIKDVPDSCEYESAASQFQWSGTFGVIYQKTKIKILRITPLNRVSRSKFLTTASLF